MQNLQLSQTKKNSSKQEEQKKEEETSKNEDKQYQQIIKDNLNNQELQNAYIEILNQEGIRFAQIGTLYQLQEHLNQMLPKSYAFNEDEIEYQRRFAEEDEEEINNNYKEDNREYIKDEEEVQNQIIEFDNSLVSQFSQSNYKSNVKNIQQAKIYDRTFVSKGQYIEIFRVKEDNENQDNLEHLCQLPIIKGLDGQSFEPRKILLQDEDTKILLLNELEQKKIYYYDIESGKIIQEFKCNENTVQDFAPQQKHPENTCFYGINSKNIFLMDPRKAEGKATSDVVQKSKIYDQNNKFTCVQSNEKGNFVIGSEDGSIRLFSEIGKMAKNKFVGFGDPILSIDTSKDLKWILATCKTYLILLPSYSAKDQQKDLYNNKVNYQDRRIPKKLTLNQEDLKALMVNQIGFTSAKFDDSINSLERFIVTSIGNFTVVWDFQKIIKGVKDCYEITRSDEIIQCAEFKFNSENKIFSASKSKLEVQKIHKSKKKN
ncbi:vacuolar import and degradation protein, putative [Ichthyophthirius multifiliis]|uniref:Vacuolar import and degradation protein, putative n=1 Tax=Ichthyophthirius multifiliis TaxID=5932 RepID=G0R5S8_ICHMU|nr:vacuolar import and degradation protein, putative [Ichthyophthirius multifiliis]EGR27186.1 vacuolar import and degradation protein, putative [Ichthyophthirius multifiliis]|eukprot:XP_004024070.1 vacuolar import and degradation protein, putative [Ichthyophthirius multifiliis]